MSPIEILFDAKGHAISPNRDKQKNYRIWG